MSTLVVEVAPVLGKKSHPNADRLELILIKGWWVAVQKDLVSVGQPVVYIPPDAVLTEEYAEKLGITKYLSPMRRNEDGTRDPGLRVRAARLRGEPSYGTIDHELDPSWTVGQDVCEILGIRKWEPPRPCLDGDAASPVTAFHQYTEFENLRNYPDAIAEGEEVVFTEKLHGKNCRTGLVLHADKEGNGAMTWMAGSHEVRRKEVDAKGRPSDFWKPLNDKLREMIRDISQNADGDRDAREANDVVVFGELINTQKGFLYGVKSGELGYRVFDISVDYKYLDHDQVEAICKYHGVEMVPILYRGPFSWTKVEEFASGPTTMCNPDQAGKFLGREGIVIKPVRERFSPILPGSGRTIGKVISVDYLEYKTKKGAEEVDASDA